MDNQATTPFGYCPSTVLLSVWPHCMNSRQNRCQDLDSFPLENWRPLGRPCNAWMKTIQQDLKSNNLFLNEAIDVAQNCPLWSGDWCLCLALCTPSGVCQKRRRKLL